MMKTINLLTGIIYESREEAKKDLGASYYRKLLKNKDITFINETHIASYGDTEPRISK